MYAAKLKRRIPENAGMNGRDPAGREELDPRTDAPPRNLPTDAQALQGREREALETMETVAPDDNVLGTMDTVMPAGQVSVSSRVARAGAAVNRVLRPQDDLGSMDTISPGPNALTPAAREELALSETHVSNDGQAEDQGGARFGDPLEYRRIKGMIRSSLFNKPVAQTKIGRFAILNHLGEGGMGVVYAAYDDKLDRKVAVKVLRGEATRTDETGRARLLREAQAMARLSHPNIVTVHEVGEHEDRVFVAMEFVRGKSLDAWLEAADTRDTSEREAEDDDALDDDERDARGRARAKPTHPWREVLQVFRQAGRGLLAAHRAGIVHRDFKPHNALLGDDGTVKVLDFGLARGVAHAGTEELVATPLTGREPVRLLDAALTRTGAIMGTPAYMSPEQHLGIPATAASDQFSFCVALYEALYGQLPFACTTLAELIKNVTDGRVREQPAGTAVPSWVRRIVLRGLASDIDERFPSMQELLTALERDPSAQRRRWLTAAGLVVVTAGSSVGVMKLQAAPPPVDTRCQGIEGELAGVWDDVRREAARVSVLATRAAHAAGTWSNVQERLDRYAADWVDASVDACEDHRDARQSEAVFDLRTACLSSRKASLDALAEVLTRADSAAVDRAVEAAAQLPSLTRCDDLEALQRAVPLPEDPAAADQVREHRDQLARARMLEVAGKYADAAKLATASLDLGEQLRYEPLIAEASLRAGSTKMNAIEPAAAEAALTRALWVGLGAGQDEVAAEAAAKNLYVVATLQSRAKDALVNAPLARTLVRRVGGEGSRIEWVFRNNLASALLDAGDVAESTREYQAALALAREHLQDDPSALLTSLNGLAVLEGNRARFDAMAALLREADEVARDALGQEHPKVGFIQFNLATALRYQGRFADPLATLEQVRTGAERDLDSNAQFMPYVHDELARTMMLRRDFASALEHAKIGLELVGETPSEPRRRLLATRGDTRLGLGELDLGLADHDASATLTRQMYGERSPERAENSKWLARARLGAAQPAEALADVLSARLTLEALGDESTLAIAELLTLRAEAQLALGQHDDALASLARARSIFVEQLPPGSAQLAPLLRLTGDVHTARGETDQATLAYREAIGIFTSTRDPDDPDLALTRFALAQSLPDGAPERVALAQQAAEVLRGLGEAYAAEAAEVERWLG